jgi:hypothetical protein
MSVTTSQKQIAIDMIEVYYKLECDSKNRPDTLNSDTVYDLFHVKRMNDTVDELLENGIPFTLYIEEWDSNQDKVLNRIYLKQENDLNIN